MITYCTNGHISTVTGLQKERSRKLHHYHCCRRNNSLKVFGNNHHKDSHNNQSYLNRRIQDLCWSCQCQYLNILPNNQQQRVQLQHHSHRYRQGNHSHKPSFENIKRTSRRQVQDKWRNSLQRIKEKHHNS